MSRGYKEDVYKFGRRLTSWREDAGLSQPQLAKLLGISQQAVSEWEVGESLPRITRVQSLATHLGISVDEIVTALTQEEGESPEERVERLTSAAEDAAERLRRHERHHGWDRQ